MNVEEITEEEQKVLYSVLKIENEIFSQTHLGTADYILLANKAGLLWSKMDISFEPRFKKVQIIKDPILDWDILACKVGTNIEMRHGPAKDNSGIQTLILTIVNERKPDFIITEYIFEPIKIIEKK